MPSLFACLIRRSVSLRQSGVSVVSPYVERTRSFGLTVLMPSAVFCGIGVNPARPSQGVDQYSLMGALVRGWRQEWGTAADQDVVPEPVDHEVIGPAGNVIVKGA